MASLPNYLMFREAVASVALSHDEGCDCKTCRAAGGDDKAMAELMVEYRRGRA